MIKNSCLWPGCEVSWGNLGSIVGETNPSLWGDRKRAMQHLLLGFPLWLAEFALPFQILKRALVKTPDVVASLSPTGKLTSAPGPSAHKPILPSAHPLASRTGTSEQFIGGSKTPSRNSDTNGTSNPFPICCALFPCRFMRVLVLARPLVQRASGEKQNSGTTPNEYPNPWKC